jgi:hypothetical protein
MEVEFYKFNKKMIKISDTFMKDPVLNFLKPDYYNEFHAEVNIETLKQFEGLISDPFE